MSSETTLVNIYIYTCNYSQLKNEPNFSQIEKDIFSAPGKEFLLVFEELQNANISNNIDSTTGHPPACTQKEKAVLLESRENINTSSAYSSCGVTSEERLEGYFCSDTVLNLIRKDLINTKIRVI